MFIRLKKTFQLSILTLSLISCQTQVLSFGTPNKAQTTHSGDPVSTEQTQINLPYVYSSAGFSDNPAIWVHAGTPSNPEVALFRHTFTTESPVASSELQIFADTRYEVWFDGEWVGRGPARFSKLLHEYDLYELGTLDPGEHLIAVLVQWAPNTRRSESEFPLLKAQMEGKVNQASQIITATGPDWKTLLSGAWRDDSTPVHAWGIIGPTELLDLRTLDPDWNQPGFTTGIQAPLH
jgi:alpha-L-rhamnosidase